MRFTMKNKYVFITALFLLALGISCTDESKYPISFDELNNANGGILKQVKQTAVTFDKTALATAKYEIEVEANDRDRGKLFTKVELFVSFVDRTPGNGNSSKPEKPVQTYMASEFVDDPITGLPRITISHTATATIALLGLVAATNVDGTDQFVFRQAMHFPDGRIFTSTNVGNAIANVPAFSSPFANIVSVVCPSDLGGVITFSSINTIAAGGPSGCTEPVTGTTTFTLTGVAGYIVGDASFGVFDCAYGDNPASGMTLSDACNLLSISGADQYGDVHSWSLVTNNGTQLVIDWVSTYPDAGRATLTRVGGWPLGLTF